MKAFDNNKTEVGDPKKPKVRIMRLNPIYPVLALVLLSLFFIQFFTSGTNSSEYGQKKSINRLVDDLEDNRVSKIVSTSEGNVYVYGKMIDVFSLKEKSNSIKSNIEVIYVSPDDFFRELFVQKKLTDQIRAFLNGSFRRYSELVLSDKFSYSISNDFRTVIISKEINVENFYKLLDEFRAKQNGKVFNVEAVSVQLLSTLASNYGDFIGLQIGLYKVFFEVDGYLVALRKDNNITRYQLDWNQNVTSLASFLQAEGFSMGTDNFSIISANLPSPVSLDLIIQLSGIVLLLFFGFIIFRSFQGGGGMGITQFGQTRAKLFFGSKTQVTFKDVAGIDEAKDELYEVVQFLKYPSKFIKLGARIPKGILMVGPPGTGKTLLARAIAGEAGVPFFHTSGSEFEEMLVGAGASRVRDLFAKAKKVAPSLIFIDEIDAVARKRGTKINTGANEQTLNQILVEMDGFETNTNVIVIAATNRPDVLDPAILRPGRFDRQIRIELPDSQGRLEILNVHAKNKKLDKSVNLSNLSKKTIGFSGADLENILNEAAIIAAKRSSDFITNEDIEEAYSKVTLGLAKKTRTRTQKEMELVAVHEAGHALVAWFLPDATPVDRISIISRGSSGGVTMFLPEKDEYIISRRKLIAEIIVTLGGRAAEEVILDDITTGAVSDIDKATDIARRFVQRFGMSENLGLVRYGEFEENDYLGYAYSNNRSYSEETASKIDKEILKLITDAYNSAKKIISENKSKLVELKDALLEKEILNKEEFEQIMRNKA
ncbi:ATP-dependent zinc metalloprotease FtsH [Candidatus Dojkabacteria bacterium]|uniref:ATP-dependent zinc metalloprotease FtsH n=1 Tax=Candidatus Dojkabacteria bacterium TaxID=2099670 RepID=A0A3M0Z2A9_9BACT|nr:MAG: ATP-dependent zinc metalloprotease FtsH [Candidatus Dojkabacteria bacterium]